MMWWIALSSALVLLGGAESLLEELSIGRGDEFPVESPKFPEPAPANWRKTWRFTSPPGTRITFDCYDIRLVQDHPPGCSDDVLMVDGGEEKMEICGNKYDFLLVTTSNVLKVEIKKGFIEGGGVQCFAKIFTPSPPTTTEPAPIILEEDWFLEAGGEPQTITSLNYPDLPASGVTQTWRLRTNPNSTIRITCPDIRTIMMDNNEICGEKVYLKIVDGSNETKLCGGRFDFTMLSTGPELNVEFKGERANLGLIKCVAQGRIMDWYGEATTPRPTTPPPPPPYLGIPSEEVDSAEHGGPPGPKTTNCRCGWTNKDSKRIVNGRDTDINEFPWVVAVIDRERKYQFCGGSLITAYHALTAAHCTVSAIKNDSPISIVVGDHNIYTDDETDASEVIDVERIIQHPDYVHYAVGEDISLLLLAKKVEFNDRVGPACLSPQRLSLARQYVKILGWGRLEWNGKSSDTLQKVDVRVIHLETCNNAFSSVSREKRVQICTYSHKKSSCQGDSGGPVVWLDPETNRYVLVGLVSFGTVCASENPAVHTDVSAYYDWIQQNIKDSVPQETCSKIDS